MRTSFPNTFRTSRLARIGQSLIVTLLLSLMSFGPAWARSRSYESKFTPFQLNRMTNDPKTNPALATFSEPLDDPIAEALKIVKLAGLMAGNCIGSKINSPLVRSFIKEKLSGLSKDKIEDSRFKADHTFQGMDFVDLAQLCAGIDYMFGPSGRLLPSAVTAGVGEMDLGPTGSDNNPYLRLQP